MKKWLFSFAIFLLSYLVFLVVTMPASFVAAKIKLPAGVNISKVSGTVWNAHIETLSIKPASHQQVIVIKQIQAQLNLLALLSFNPSVDITFGGRLLDGPRGKLTLNNLFNQISISDTNINFDANEISQRLSLAIEAQALGEIKVHLKQFSLGKPLCQSAKGKITWQRAAINAFEQTVELGTLNAAIHCEKGVLALKVEPKNTLGLTFTAYIRSSTQVSGNGYLTPSATLPKAIRDVLPFLGKPDSKGRYLLRF